MDGNHTGVLPSAYVLRVLGHRSGATPRRKHQGHAPFPSTNASLQHQPQQYKASLMRTVIMMLIRSSSLMAPWVLSTSASPWSKHTVSSKYLREEVEMVFLGHSAQHAPVHL